MSETTKMTLPYTRAPRGAIAAKAGMGHSLPTEALLSTTLSRCARPVSPPLPKRRCVCRIVRMLCVRNVERMRRELVSTPDHLTSEHLTLTARAVGLVETQRAFSLVSRKPRGATRTLPTTRPFFSLASLTSVQSRACTLKD